MSKWIFGSLTMEYNPSQDSGWQKEHVRGTPHPIGRTRSVYQKGGHKSPTRKIAGLVKSASEKATLKQLYQDETNFRLVDHTGDATNQVCIDEQKWEAILDVTNSANDFTSWKYDMVLIVAR